MSRIDTRSITHVRSGNRFWLTLDLNYFEFSVLGGAVLVQLASITSTNENDGRQFIPHGRFCEQIIMYVVLDRSFGFVVLLFCGI